MYQLNPGSNTQMHLPQLRHSRRLARYDFLTDMRVTILKNVHEDLKRVPGSAAHQPIYENLVSIFGCDTWLYDFHILLSEYVFLKHDVCELIRVNLRDDERVVPL